MAQLQIKKKNRRSTCNKKEINYQTNCMVLSKYGNNGQPRLFIRAFPDRCDSIKFSYFHERTHKTDTPEYFFLAFLKFIRTCNQKEKS